MSNVLKEKVYNLIKSSGLILDQVLSEKYNNNLEKFYDSSYQYNFFEILPKKNLTKYIKYLAKNLEEKEKEIKEFKTLIHTYGKYLYSPIVEELVFEINEDLSNMLSDDYEDEGSV